MGIKEKVKKFWDRNKEVIIGGGLFLLGGIGLWYAVKEKNPPTDEELEKMVRNEIGNDEPAKGSVRYEEPKELQGEPLLGGGHVDQAYVLEGFDKEITEFIVNDVPMESLGQFGQDMAAKLAEHYPDRKEPVMACMIIDLHEKEIDAA